jgi:hypothetical protein
MVTCILKWQKDTRKRQKGDYPRKCERLNRTFVSRSIGSLSAGLVAELGIRQWNLIWLLYLRD